MNVSKMIPLHVIDGAGEVGVWRFSLARKTHDRKKIKYCLEINYERKIEWNVQSKQKYDNPISGFDVYCLVI